VRHPTRRFRAAVHLVDQRSCEQRIIGIAIAEHARLLSRRETFAQPEKMAAAIARPADEDQDCDRDLGD